MTIRQTSPTHVGNIVIGGGAPIRVQSMTTTDTNDTAACVAQAKRIIDAGGELVRLTTQGRREAENMANISAALKADGSLPHVWQMCTSTLMWLTLLHYIAKRFE